tara:strand:- start:196 stop:336 length:141 start_codon:yes stop_codon:yes gene_type:complete
LHIISLLTNFKQFLELKKFTSFGKLQRETVKFLKIGDVLQGEVSLA